MFLKRVALNIGSDGLAEELFAVDDFGPGEVAEVGIAEAVGFGGGCEDAGERGGGGCAV